MLTEEKSLEYLQNSLLLYNEREYLIYDGQ